MANTERTGLSAFAQQRVTALDDMLLDERFIAPLLNAGVDPHPFAISGGADKAGVDLQQRRANDACGFI